MIRHDAMFMYLNSLRLHQSNPLLDVATSFSKNMEELGEQIAGDTDLPHLPPLHAPPVTTQSQPHTDSNSTQSSNILSTPRDKLHHCPTCLKPFRSKQQLSQHDLVHNGIRRHQCSYCDKCFKQLSHLQQHVRIHTGEKPYRCNVEECDRAFAQLSNLQHHLRNHDDQVKKAATKQFKCLICHRCYTNESSLKSHTLKMHIHIKPLDQLQVQELANRQRNKRKQKNPMYAPTMVPMRNRENGNPNDCVITRVDHNLDLRQVMRERQLSQNAHQLRENLSLTERPQNGQMHNSLFSNSASDHHSDEISSLERRAQRELLLHEPLASASLQMFSNQSLTRRPSSAVPTSLGSLTDGALSSHQSSRDLYSPLPSHHIDHSTSPSPYPSLNLNVSSNPYPAHINHINRHLTPSTITPAHQHYTADFNNSAMRLSHRLPHMMVSPMASNHMSLPTAPSRLLDTMPFSPLGN